MGNKELNMKLGQLQEKISKASLTVGADLSNDFKSIVLETSQWRLSPFMRLFWKEQQKYLQSSQNNATYHPMNPDTDITYQTVNLFSSDKCFIYFISDVQRYIRSNQHNTVQFCKRLMYSIHVLDTCGTMICSYFWIAFLLFFMKIENTVYTSFENSMLLFINGLIFDIVNIQNNQSLEFEWVSMLAPFVRSVNVFVKSFQDWPNSVQ